MLDDLLEHSVEDEQENALEYLVDRRWFCDKCCILREPFVFRAGAQCHLGDYRERKVRVMELSDGTACLECWSGEPPNREPEEEISTFWCSSCWRKAVRVASIVMT